MNKSLCLVAAAFIILASGCKEQEFKKSPDGSEYKIFGNENGKKAVKGDFIQLNILAKYKDSVLFSSIDNSMPRFIPFDTSKLPPFFKEIHEGDSLVIRESTDTLIKKGSSAPFMQKGQFIYQSFKVVKLFSTKEAADSVAKTFVGASKAIAYKKAVEQIEKDIAANAPLVKEDDKLIADFLAKNNIKANKTAWGTYVSITTPGTGQNISQNDVAVVNYTGKTFKDSTFDSNTDSSFQHVEPLEVDMSQFTVMPGWIDGLKMMQKGSKGKIIIPSYLAYGKNGRAPKIGPDENLVFDIDVTDVISQDQYQKDMEEKQKMMQMRQQEMQQKMMEQMQKQRQNQEKQPAPPKGK
jgi:FKBP-type peptidyl-prolyl cis-trans isomerase FkpA